MYCNIIGYPLKNPRSVKIWNRYFKQKKIKSKMISKEVKLKNLKKILKKFKEDNKFLGSAVTMPYKKKIFKLLPSGDNLTKFAQSANLIVKQNKL